MNQAQLIDRMAALTGDRKAAKIALETFKTSVLRALRSGDKVAIADLGVFSVVDRKARNGRNPQTGKALQIPASRAVKFSAAKSLKDAVK